MRWCFLLQPGYDVRGSLRGAWFSRSIDLAPDPPLFDLQTGALSAILDNLRPLTHVQIGIGAGAYSPLDPTDALEQLDNALSIPIDRTPGARINPDPFSVTRRSGTVCYDLAYNEGGGTRYNALLFNVAGPRELLVRLDTTARLAPQCAFTDLSVPDAPSGGRSLETRL